eukprot:scaffold66_cov115-Cylindrotheca_fusiformis.AAC.14
MENRKDHYKKRRPRRLILGPAMCSAQQKQPSHQPSNSVFERTGKKENRIALRGIGSLSNDRAPCELLSNMRRSRDTTKDVKEAGLMRDKSRRSALSGIAYQQQNRSELSLPGAFRMTPNGFIDEDPSVMSASTRETNTLYIPSASPVGDLRSAAAVPDYDFERGVGVGVPVARSQDGLYMNKCQIRLLFLFFGVLVAALISGLVTAVNKRAREEFPSTNTTSPNPSPFPHQLEWSDDQYSDVTNDTVENVDWSIQPSFSPSKDEMPSSSPSAQNVRTPTETSSVRPATATPTVATGFPSPIPSEQPTIAIGTLSPSTAIPQSWTPSSPPTLLPTTFSSSIPTVKRKPGSGYADDQENDNTLGSGNAGV